MASDPSGSVAPSTPAACGHDATSSTPAGTAEPATGGNKEGSAPASAATAPKQGVPTAAESQVSRLERLVLCTCRGSGHGEPLADAFASEQDYYEAWICFQHAFACDPIGFWTPAPAHACDNLCPLLNHRELHTCCLSGHTHLCTDQACDRIRVTEDGRVCELTGKVYMLDWAPTYEQGADSTGKRRVQVGGGSNSKKRRATNALEVSRPRMRKEEPSPPPLPRNHSITPLDTQNTILNAVRKIMPCASNTVSGLSLHSEELRVAYDKANEALVPEILGIYHWMCQTQIFHPSKAGYKLDIHTLIVLHNMSLNGETTGGVQYIRPNEHVRQFMPDLVKALSILNCKPNVHTQHVNIFNTAMVEHCMRQRARTSPTLSSAR